MLCFQRCHLRRDFIGIRVCVYAKGIPPGQIRFAVNCAEAHVNTFRKKLLENFLYLLLFIHIHTAVAERNKGSIGKEKAKLRAYMCVYIYSAIFVKTLVYSAEYDE